ncbi:hypothetical protein BM1_06672 [Bipolaris maydis]|nr:hypothetical protein BM1_06672 [Bipolaris maydis]
MAPTQSKLASYELPLRILTLLTSLLALPLLIATTVVSIHNYSWYRYRPVTAFCFGFIPLALTAFASTRSLVHQRRFGRMPQASFKAVDGVACIAYLSILTAIWAVEIGYLERPGFGLLAGYTTAPMILNISFTTRAPQVQETKQSGEYSLLRGEDYLDVDPDAEHYTDGSSGPADAQILRPENESKGEFKGELKVEFKGESKKAIIDV